MTLGHGCQRVIWGIHRERTPSESLGAKNYFCKNAKNAFATLILSNVNSGVFQRLHDMW